MNKNRFMMSVIRPGFSYLYVFLSLGICLEIFYAWPTTEKNTK